MAPTTKNHRRPSYLEMTLVTKCRGGENCGRHLHLSRAKETRWANSAPDYSRSSEQISVGADESVLLVRCADVRDVC